MLVGEYRLPRYLLSPGADCTCFHGLESIRYGCSNINNDITTIPAMINVFLAVKILLVHDPMAYACVITPYTQRLLHMKEYCSSCLSSCTTDLPLQARFHEFRLGKDRLTFVQQY
jgi:hypothetical protein